MLCKICHAAAIPVFTAKILNKYDAVYFRCSSCDFMQTEEPHWLRESYASAINEIDLGPVNRSMIGSRLIEGLILSSLDKDAKFVDYGGGYGLLVRLMRDRGFDYYWQDNYCENLFAKHFVAKGDMKFELLSAFEVFEHLVDPLSEITKMLDYSDNLVFSTLIVPGKPISAEDWWYFAPEHGQHVSFYTIAALQAVAKMFDLHFCTDEVGTHLLSKRPVSNRFFRFFASESRLSRIACQLLRRRMRQQSLLISDFKTISGHTL